MPPPPEVSVATVLVKEVRPWDEFTGHIEAVETVELRPRVSGYIDRVNYVEGGEVTKGDVLFVIDQRTYRAELARAEAELARATTQAELARSEVVRAKRLADARAISTEELDQRNSALAQAESNIHVAQSAVDVAKLDLEFTEVRAPISGRAGRALVTSGNLVSTQPNATLLTTIVSLDPVYVYFEGDERSYLRYNAMSRSGERASSRDVRNPVRVGLAGDAGYPHDGEMDFMDNQVNPDTGTIRARAVLPNPDRPVRTRTTCRQQHVPGHADRRQGGPDGSGSQVCLYRRRGRQRAAPRCTAGPDDRRAAGDCVRARA
jgi:multidrug efflux system membrane fusion protein